MAATCGHLDVIMFMRSKGCDWNYKVIEYALDRGHTHVVEWARANGCPEPY